MFYSLVSLHLSTTMKVGTNIILVLNHKEMDKIIKPRVVDDKLIK